MPEWGVFISDNPARTQQNTRTQQNKPPSPVGCGGQVVTALAAGLVEVNFLGRFGVALVRFTRTRA